MQINQSACATLWKEYAEQLPASHPHRGVQPDAFAFGDSESLADELAELVLRGIKRATTSLAIEFTALGERLPQSGDLSVIARGDGLPVAIIERIAVKHLPFSRVDAAFAALEGEGDGSLEYWRAAHNDYFTEVCNRLGGAFDANTLVICQSFRLLWCRAGEIENAE